MINVIIPALYMEEMTGRCINLLQSHTPIDRLRVIVVDNGGTFYREGIDIVQGDPSWGFAHSCNCAAELYDDGDFWLLNNDVEITSDVLSPLQRVLAEDPAVGVVGCRLMFPNGNVQHAGSSFNKGEPNHPGSKVPLDQSPQALVSREAEGVTFACALIRRECWDELDGLDEIFEFAYEDIDFCLRAPLAGWKVWYCADAVAVHRNHVTQLKHLKSVRPRSRRSLEELRKRWG